MPGEFPALAELKAGNDAAWNIAFSFLWPIALSAARNASAFLTVPEAEEAASDAIRSAIDRIQQVHTEEKLRGLVAVIAHRRAISVQREKFAQKRGNGQHPEQSALPDEAHPWAERPDPRDPARDLLAAEALVLLSTAMAELDQESKDLLAAKFFDGYSYEELSKRSGVPVGTLCPKVMRALQKVRRTLRKSPDLMQELREILR